MAFDIIKITFQIEEWLQQVPGSLVHNMTTVQFERYSTLAKEKADMIEEIRTLMVSYEDMQSVAARPGAWGRVSPCF